MVHYKLSYFNGRGLAELARYLFAAAGQDYEDFRFDQEGWKDVKPHTPLGQVPLLEVKEDERIHQISQSNTIARYLANKFGLAGKDEFERAQAEMVLDQFSDLAGEYREAFYGKNSEEVKKQKLERFHSEIVPHHFGVLENFFAKNTKGFAVGDSLTVADLSVAVNVERFLSENKDLLEKFPHVKAINDNVSNHPKIVEWRAKRPVTPF